MDWRSCAKCRASKARSSKPWAWSARSPRRITAGCSMCAPWSNPRISRFPTGAWACTPTIPIANRCRASRPCIRCSPRPTAATACSRTAIALAAQLRAIDPEAFALLTRTPVPFRYRGTGADLYAERPLIELSCSGEIAAVAYNNRSIQPLRLPAAECRTFYAAYRRFARTAARAALPAGHAAGGRRPGAVRQPTRAARPQRIRIGAPSAPPAGLLPDARQRLQQDGACCASACNGDAAMTSAADELLSIYTRRGAGAYFGEAVTMTQHGLQAAYFAEQHGAPECAGAGLAPA